MRPQPLQVTVGRKLKSIVPIWTPNQREALHATKAIKSSINVVRKIYRPKTGSKVMRSKNDKKRFEVTKHSSTKNRNDNPFPQCTTEATLPDALLEPGVAVPDEDQSVILEPSWLRYPNYSVACTSIKKVARPQSQLQMMNNWWVFPRERVMRSKVGFEPKKI